MKSTKMIETLLNLL